MRHCCFDVHDRSSFPTGKTRILELVRYDVRYAGKPVMSADVDFSISENPNFRFYFVPADGGELEARVADNEDLEFVTTVGLAKPPFILH